jgi:hypothetical protein
MAHTKPTTGTVEQRFRPKVDKRGPDDCWPWTASKVPDGYGKLNFKGTMLAAHRIAWELERGEIPDGLLVLHTCDHPGCCNPAHLFLGTNQDNADDKVRKGRHRSVHFPGEENPQARLTEEDVRSIRRLAATTDRLALAARFGVGRGHVNDIIGRRRWKHVG